MEKFTRMEKKITKQENKESIKFNNDDFEIIEYDNKDIIKEKDKIVILPYLKDEGRILLKYDNLPNFNYRLRSKNEYKHEYNYLTTIKGDILEDEDLFKQVKKILYNDCGIVLSSTYSINIDKSFFRTENSTGFYYVSILELKYNDFKQSVVNNKEDVNKVVRINLNEIFDIKVNDLVTEYLFLKLKYDYNLK